MYFLLKTDESPFLFCSLTSNPWVQRDINGLDTVAFSVFLLYLFTVTASINFYACFG